MGYHSRSPSYSRFPPRYHEHDRRENNEPARRRSRSRSPVDTFRPEHRRFQTTDEKTIFCKGIPYDATERDILSMKLFRKASGMRLLMESHCDKNKGFGFIYFDSVHDVEDVYEERHNASLFGRNLYLDYCGERSKNYSRRGARDRSPYRDHG